MVRARNGWEEATQRAPSGTPRAAPRVSTSRALIALAAGLAVAGSAVSAQTLADPLVPGGRLRLDFAPSFSSWDSRYGIYSSGGSSVEGEESLGSDLTDPHGTSIFPGVALLQESLRSLTGENGYEAILGSVTGQVTHEVTRIDAGLHVGVFDWLTVGVNVPWVRTRTTVDVAFRDAGGDLGLNPSFTDPDPVSALLVGLDDAVAGAQSRSDALCGGGGGAACDNAQALAERVADFRTRMRSAYLASPFFPRGTSPVATSLQSSLADLDDALAAAGLAPVGASLAFAAEGIDPTTFAGLASRAGAGIEGSAPLGDVLGDWGIGDIEISAHARILEGEARDSGAVAPRFAYALSGGALVRLGTGSVDDPDVFLDVGTGDGQMDIEGRLDGALRVGPRFTLRGSVRHGIQGATTLVRRVAPHEAALPSSYSRRGVRWSPGAYTRFVLSPGWYVSDALALALDYAVYHKGDDSYTLLGGQIPGLPTVDPGDLEHESSVTLQEASIGLRYNTIPAWRDGRAGTPISLGARLVQPVGGGGGRTPKATRVEVSVSLFRALWGN